MDTNPNSTSNQNNQQQHDQSHSQQSQDASTEVESTYQSITSHLIELRSRLIKSVLAIVITTLALFPFANELYQQLALPLMQSLGEQGGRMIATQVASPFLTPFKLSLISGIFLAMPILLYQLWNFVAPALYRHEKQLAIPLLILSVILFYLGVCFAYFVLFPVMFTFLSGTAPEGVEVATDITLYLDFAIKIFFAFGFAFQIPVITILLVLTNLVQPSNIAKKRPYIIVGAFIVGMLLTPPDVISQVLLAIPIWLLFEIGLITGKILKRLRLRSAQKADSKSESS